MRYRSSVLTLFLVLVFIATLLLSSMVRPPSVLAKEPDWSQPIPINDDRSVGVEREDPHMAVSGSGQLYVVWIDHRNSQSDIYFAYSADQGASWNANVQVTADSAGALYPQVAIDAKGKIYVAYTRGSGVYLRTSTDNGNSWTAEKTVASVHNPIDLRLVSDRRSGYEGHLNLMWLIMTNLECTGVSARHIASIDGGKSWYNNAYVLVGPYNSEFVDLRGMDFYRRGPVLRAALHNLPVNSDILSSSSHNNGKDWSMGLLTPESAMVTSEPSVAIDPNKLSVYAYHSGTAWLTAKNSRPGTEGWKKSTINSTAAEEIMGPAALATYRDGRYYATWTQKKFGSNIRHLYFSESNDYGRSWSADVVLTEANHHGKHSSLGVDDDGNLYTVWYDQEDYKAFHDIMFSRRGPSTGTPTPPKPVIVEIPSGGGSITSNDPLEQVTCYVPPEWDAVILELRYKPTTPTSAASAETSDLKSAGVWFEVSATDKDGQPVIDLTSPMTISVSFLDDGSVMTDTLKLYGWNGTEYVDDGIIQVSRTEHTVTSTVDHLTTFNLMGEVPDSHSSLYLPAVIRPTSD